MHGLSLGGIVVPSIRRYGNRVGSSETKSIHTVHQCRWLGRTPSQIHLSPSDNNHQDSEISPSPTQQPWVTGLVIASVVSSSVLGLPFLPLPDVANAMELSSGTTTFETTITKDELINKSVSTAARLVQTLLKDRIPLTQSVKTIQSTVVQELSSDTWEQIRTIVMELQQDLSSATTINLPADWKQTLQDLKDGKINVIVNGEIINVSLEKIDDPKRVVKGNGVGTTKDGETPSVNEITGVVVLPDDEWVLRVRGYKGIDPNVVATEIVSPKKTTTYSLSYPILGFLDDWDKPYPSEYLMDGVSKTYGDIWVFQGVLVISFIYAWSYAYYGGVLEQQDNDAKAKQAAAKARAVVKQVEVPKQRTKKKVVEKTETAVPAKETDVDVVIDFDEQGKVVITTTETKKSRDGVVSFLQALYFPWLGLVVPGMTMKLEPLEVKEDVEEQESEPGFFSFVRALYFPWVGILQGK